MWLIRRVFAAGLASLVVGGFLTALTPPGPVDASRPKQVGSEAPEISNPECSFWFDYDKDDEGDESLPDTYVLQETPIVGGCDFRLKSPETATILVDSELKDWELELEIKREPRMADEFRMYPGRNEIPGVQGSMRVTANFVRGNTPRSVKSRTLRDEYRHEVQIPEEFRLLEITVTNPDGSNDRLERNAQSASGAYIAAYQSISNAEGQSPQWAITLAQEWLEDGYPQVAESIITRAATQDTGKGGSGWWMWATIGTWVVVIVIASALATYYVLTNRTPREHPVAPGGNDL